MSDSSARQAFPAGCARCDSREIWAEAMLKSMGSSSGARVISSIVEAIGNTPPLELVRMTRGLPGQILLKYLSTDLWLRA